MQKSGAGTATEQTKAGGAKTSFVPPATALQRSIRGILEGVTAKQMELQELLDALKEADKGKVQPLQNLLSGAAGGKEDQILDLEKRVWVHASLFETLNTHPCTEFLTPVHHHLKSSIICCKIY